MEIFKNIKQNFNENASQNEVNAIVKKAEWPETRTEIN